MSLADRRIGRNTSFPRLRVPESPRRKTDRRLFATSAVVFGVAGTALAAVKAQQAVDIATQWLDATSEALDAHPEGKYLVREANGYTVTRERPQQPLHIEIRPLDGRKTIDVSEDPSTSSSYTLDFVEPRTAYALRRAGYRYPGQKDKDTSFAITAQFKQDQAVVYPWFELTDEHGVPSKYQGRPIMLRGVNVSVTEDPQYAASLATSPAAEDR